MDLAEAPPPPPSAPRPRRFASGKLLFESALIIGSVALGFVVTEWRVRVADRELAHRILSNIVNEVSENRTRLAAQIAHHDALGKTLRESAKPAPGESGWQVITRSLTSGIDALPMRQAAWDAAVSSGALRVIDYDIASRLSEIYVLQNEGYGRSVERISLALFVPDAFTPGRAAETTDMFRALAGELLGIETYLLEVYERHLPALREAAAK